MARTREQIEEAMKRLIDENKLIIFAHFQSYHSKMNDLEQELHGVLKYE